MWRGKRKGEGLDQWRERDIAPNEESERVDSSEEASQLKAIPTSYKREKSQRVNLKDEDKDCHLKE